MSTRQLARTGDRGQGQGAGGGAGVLNGNCFEILQREGMERSGYLQRYGIQDLGSAAHCPELLLLLLLICISFSCGKNETYKAVNHSLLFQMADPGSRFRVCGACVLSWALNASLKVSFPGST